MGHSFHGQKSVSYGMGCRIWNIKSLALCIFFTFILGCFIALSPITDDCRCSENTHVTLKYSQNKVNEQDPETLKHKLALLVPYRDRFEELLEFGPYMHKFLSQQNIDHDIYILNQVDRYRFNRASLINVGFREVCIECDYIAMHDVDLLPVNSQLSYNYPKTGPFHVASPDLHPRYHYPTFVGGILLITRQDFEQVNGMSNKYWGWGLEDDEFYVRLKEANLNVTRPYGVTTGRNSTFKHTHDRIRRKRDMAKCFNQREVTRKRDRQTGLNDVSYTLIGSHQLTIDGAPLTILNIHLHCNQTLTPWCDCGAGSVNKSQSSKQRT